MPDYNCFGVFNEAHAGHSEHYFSQRYTWLDFRGELRIAPTAVFGFCNRILTQSHGIHTGQFQEPTVDKRVIIEDYAWITSYCVLYDCVIGHHAIVSVGSVVDHMTVPPYTIVKGNPAMPVATWNGEKWVRVNWMETTMMNLLWKMIKDLLEKHPYE